MGATPQTTRFSLLLTNSKPYGKNGPHKNGEGGYASKEEVLGALGVAAGGAAIAAGHPEIGVPLASWGTWEMVESGSGKLIEKYGRSEASDE